MKTRHLVLALCLGFAGAAQAQVVGYNFRTGDVWVDNQLGYMNDYGRYQRDYFVDDIVGSYGAPRYLVNDLLGNRGWDPGDVYYASALAYQLRRPLSDVVRERDRNRGQGWGVIAQRMGIKPGSAAFHALKGNLDRSDGRYRTRFPDKGKGKPSQPGTGGNIGNGNDVGPAQGQGQGKGKDKGGQGQGKGKDKGKGH